MISAHRALADVEAMERLFVSTPLVGLLSTLPMRSGVQQIELWQTQQAQHGRCMQLLGALGKKITAAQARRLDIIGLSFDAMQHLRRTCPDKDAFKAALKQRGVNSRPLCDKLASVVK